MIEIAESVYYCKIRKQKGITDTCDNKTKLIKETVKNYTQS